MNIFKKIVEFGAKLTGEEPVAKESVQEVATENTAAEETVAVAEEKAEATTETEVVEEINEEAEEISAVEEPVSEELKVEIEKVKRFSEKVNKVKAELAKDVVGQSEVINFVITAIVAGGNVLLEGIPGVGKTRLVRSLGRVLSLPFSRIQFTPDLMPSDVTGTNVVEKDEEGKLSTSFRPGPIFANLVLADEINRATPKTQSAMLEVMQEHKVTVGKSTYKIDEPFFVLATENPIEQDGTYPLPEAQMDRFMFKLIVDFPSEEELVSIVKMTQITLAETAEAVLNGEEILEMRKLAAGVPVVDDVILYAVGLVSNTHPELSSSCPSTKKYVKYGASPRAAQALITAAKVRALMQGRYNVSYADVDALAHAALRHRIKVNYTAINEKLGVDDVISMIIKETKKGTR